MDELSESVRTIIGERTDDEALAFLEDFNDTIGDVKERIENDIDWEQKYRDNDAEWRKKYTERFYSPKPKDEPDEPDEPDVSESPKTFADLFKTV